MSALGLADLEGHAATFFADADELASTVAEYLADHLAAGRPALVVAFSDHLRRFDAALTASGVDVAAARADGLLVTFDSAATLARIAPGGTIDPEAFDAVVAPAVQAMASKGAPLRAFGEMVGLLWEAGDVQGAIDLEACWNELAGRVPFTLLCGYPAVADIDHEPGDVLSICGCHTTVLGRDEARVEVWRRFEATIEAPREARSFVAEAVRAVGSAALSDAAAVVTSELATNAVLHARSAFHVVVATTGAAVKIEVHDEASSLPSLRSFGRAAQTGRGLRLVAALSRQWGADLVAGRKIVWAELAV